MTKEEILKRVKKFQGANREFSQELPPIIEGLIGLIDEAGPEVVNNLTSNSPTKALSANMGKELKLMVDGKVSEPEAAGTDGQVLSIQSGSPAWIDAPEGTVVIDSAMSDSSTNTVQNKVIKEYADENFAKKDGYYGSLTAGAAENIVGQSAIEGTFLFRTTAGDADISNGVATIEAVKGNSVAWNQLVDALVHNRVNYTSNTVDGVTTFTRVDDTLDSLVQFRRVDCVSGHKYYCCLLIKGDGTVALSAGGTAFLYEHVSYSNYTLVSRIVTAPQSGNVEFTFAQATTDSGVFSVRNTHNVYDLTLMGIDNLTTVAQVESWLAANIGSKPYYPASSKLLSTKLLKYVSRGFNQWDEEWENAFVDPFTGLKSPSDRVATKNFIPVFPNTQYYKKTATSGFWNIYYDGNKQYISYGNASEGVFTTPENCYYIQFSTEADYGTTYNHDININLSWDGSRDGEYEQSEIHEYNIDVTKFYGKLNGEGDLTQIFPGGMRKADYAGTVRDILSLKDAEADVKVGSVDLGDLTWQESGLLGDGYYYATMPNDVKVAQDTNIICPKYATVTDWTSVDKSIQHNNSEIRVHDSAYSDPDTFKTAMSGVYLDCELATPIHYTDLVYRDNGVDTPVEALNVIVNNWSTEEEIIAAPEASGDPNSCAATLDILYGIDAAEQLDTINQSGIFTDDLKANLSALIGVINTNCATALGGTLAISDNPTEKVYTFTFTPSTPESQGD